MATRKKAVDLDPHVTMALVLEDLLTYIVLTSDRNPADPAAIAALKRLDNHRREIQLSLGQDATDIPDPHGRLPITSTDKGE